MLFILQNFQMLKLSTTFSVVLFCDSISHLFLLRSPHSILLTHLLRHLTLQNCHPLNNPLASLFLRHFIWWHFLGSSPMGQIYSLEEAVRLQAPKELWVLGAWCPVAQNASLTFITPQTVAFTVSLYHPSG